MVRTRVAVIADDLTGALDATSPFALLGWRVVVATSLATLDQLLATNADVVAVALGSREVTAVQAADRAGVAARRLVEVTCIFKKIDSRMKGHVAAEVAAVMAELGVSSALVCPAIPDFGRVVLRGAVEGAGIAVPIPVARALDGVAAVIPDASSAADLDAILADFGGGLLVGARGLAVALARRMGRKIGVAPAPAPLHVPLVVAVGSRDPITLAQVARVRDTRQTDWIGAPDGVVPEGKTSANVVIVQAVNGPGATATEVSGRLARGLCRDHLVGCRTVVLTGGETAAAVLAEMGVGLLDLLGEILPGLPLCRALAREDGPLIVTKSGGFGDDDCLLQIINAALGAGAAVA